MKILVLCPYPEARAPSQRLKFEQYYDSWREAGFQVEVRPFWDERVWEVLFHRGKVFAKTAGFMRGLRRRASDLARAREADLVYIHLEAAPLGPPQLERRIHAAGIPIVYDIDDLVHLPHASPANPFMRWARAPGKIPELIRMAEHTIVCTEYQREFALRHTKHATNI